MTKKIEKNQEVANALMALANASTIRTGALTKLFDERRDIDVECGYPKDITTEMYDALYQREGIALRVVSILPEDSWSEDPRIFETEDPEDITDFEEAWDELVDEKNLYHYLHRVDELSGIGRFGVLLLGIDDGKELNQPVDGISEKGESGEGGETATRKLIYLRAFSESNVKVKSREDDTSNPRYGQPVLYSVTFQDNIGAASSSELQGVTGDSSASTTRSLERVVHWSRVIHVADNRKTSEIFGTPRMKPVFNRLLDLRKILGGSGEMFWKGAFPGYSFEMSPEAAADGAVIDAESIRQEFEDYSNGLQRYMATTGLSAKSLAPQVADPTKHVETNMRAIAITLGIPYRIFLGTEEAKLASSQDVKTWNKRINRRQDKYISPLIIRPFIDRLIATGILPAPTDEFSYTVDWPDLNAPTDQDKAENAKTIAEALAKYLGGGVDAMIPPAEWLTMFMGRTPQEVERLMEAAEERIDDEDLNEDEEEEVMRQQEEEAQAKLEDEQAKEEK